MSADTSQLLDSLLPAIPEPSDEETALAVTCVARHSCTRAELAETCAMLGLDGDRTPRSWMPSAQRAVPDSFRRERTATGKRR